MIDGMRTGNNAVNLMHFRDGTPCFWLKGNNDWWDKEGTRGHILVLKSNRSLVNPTHFRYGTP